MCQPTQPYFEPSALLQYIIGVAYTTATAGVLPVFFFTEPTDCVPVLVVLPQRTPLQPMPEAIVHAASQHEVCVTPHRTMRTSLSATCLPSPDPTELPLQALP